MLLGFIAAFALSLSGAGDATSLDTIRTAGVLRVGTTGDYKPFSYRDPAGNYIGLDVDMAASLAQALGVGLELVATSWPTLMQDVASHRFDIVMSGVSVTPERARLAQFSQPYLHDGKTAITRCENVTRFSALADIDRPDVRVIVNPGGTNERFVRSHLHQAVIAVYPDNVTIFERLAAGAADVMITDAVEARLQQHLHPQLCAVHPDAPFEVVDKAYLLPDTPSHDTTLKAFVDQWLAAMHARGEMDAAFARWLNYPWEGRKSAVVASDEKLAALLGLMRERLVISVDVARSKWNSGAPIEDLKREDDIIAGLARQAGELGLPVPWAERFFRAQIEASKRMQRELHAQWRAQGLGKFDTAPDLARDIRPRLDALTPRLFSAIAAAWPVLCDPERATAALQVARAEMPAPPVGAGALEQALSGLQGGFACTAVAAEPAISLPR